MLYSLVQAVALSLIVGHGTAEAPFEGTYDTIATSEFSAANPLFFVDPPAPPEGYFYVGIRVEAGVSYWEYQNLEGNVHLIRMHE